MKVRVYNTNIPRQLCSTLREFLGIEEEEIQLSHDKSSRKRRRCDLCDRKKDRKGNEFCVKCKRILCAEHKKVICVSCYKTHP